jgi:hypothetical protein
MTHKEMEDAVQASLLRRIKERIIRAEESVARLKSWTDLQIDTKAVIDEVDHLSNLADAIANIAEALASVASARKDPRTTT